MRINSTSEGEAHRARLNAALLGEAYRGKAHARGIHRVAEQIVKVDSLAQMNASFDSSLLLIF